MQRRNGFFYQDDFILARYPDVAALLPSAMLHVVKLLPGAPESGVTAVRALVASSDSLLHPELLLTSQMIEDGAVRASRFFQGIGQDEQSLGIERFLVVGCGETNDDGREPGAIPFDGVEGTGRGGTSGHPSPGEKCS